jgi:RNA polymerase sigma-70 factor (ECF subfamily)
MDTIAGTSDADLARAVAASRPGTADAAETELYRRFAPRIRLYGLRHLRNEDNARDLVQQVMLTTIEKLRSGAVRDVEQIASFVLGTSRSMATDLKRRERRRDALLQTFAVEEASTPTFGEALDVNRLEQCLGRLGPRERSVLLLTFYGEKTSGEVAAELGLTGGNVRVIRHRAMDQLRTCVTTGGRTS